MLVEREHVCTISRMFNLLVKTLLSNSDKGLARVTHQPFKLNLSYQYRINALYLGITVYYFISVLNSTFSLV